MQIYALDPDVGTVYANHALKHQDYYCLECRGIVRLRGGMHRQNHFYHLHPNHTCTLHAKSLTHLQIQYFLYRLFPEEDCRLEHRFSEINRIADVVWFSRKLIFEIQCSSISEEEVMRRNQDYASVGYQVIWILHESRYNQWRITAAENYLKEYPHYFTDINSRGEGKIYDQLALFDRGIRKRNFAQLSVDLSLPTKLLPEQIIQLEQLPKMPKMIMERAHQWSLFFTGDLISSCLQHWQEFPTAQYLEEMFYAERECDPQHVKTPPLDSFFNILKFLYEKGIARPYRLVFHILLEKACK
jgi:competence protein CoiA